MMASVRTGVCLGFLSLMLLTATATGACLVVSAGEGGRCLVSLHVEDGCIIHLDFINSIYLAPVRETFLHEVGRGLSIIRVESPSAGVFEYYRIETDGPSAELYRNVGSIRLKSHDYRNHTVTVGERVLRLKDFAAGGDPLTISVRDGGCTPDEGR
jgi:hypothetical protein